MSGEITGEPEPIGAPAVLPRARAGRIADPGRSRPPEGRGPAIAAHRADRRSVLLGAALVVLLVVLGTSLRRGGLEWAASPLPWVLIALVTLAASARDWLTRLSAGKDWLKVGRRWVDTYRITEVRLSGLAGGRMLRLRDAGGRRVRVHMGLLAGNRRLWSLVYGGLAHSVQTGATCDRRAEQLLDLRRFRT